MLTAMRGGLNGWIEPADLSTLANPSHDFALIALRSTNSTPITCDFRRYSRNFKTDYETIEASSSSREGIEAVVTQIYDKRKGIEFNKIYKDHNIYIYVYIGSNYYSTRSVLNIIQHTGGSVHNSGE